MVAMVLVSSSLSPASPMAAAAAAAISLWLVCGSVNRNGTRYNEFNRSTQI